MEKTLEKAKILDAIEIITLDGSYLTSLNQINKKPTYKYLIILDFESTCWNSNENSKSFPEIIEFPAVLLNLENGTIVSEFRQYCMPMITPKLSKFCINFTGISQEKVDNGVPLKTCLMLFSQWLKECADKFGVRVEQTPKNTLFVTWTDWDLNICLHNECKRKRIIKPEFFNEWMDLKYKFKELYKVNPKGLRGALEMKGLQFEGREHCGLDDAKNTARLAKCMFSEGMFIEPTKTRV